MKPFYCQTLNSKEPIWLLYFVWVIWQISNMAKIWSHMTKPFLKVNFNLKSGLDAYQKFFWVLGKKIKIKSGKTELLWSLSIASEAYKEDTEVHFLPCHAFLGKEAHPPGTMQSHGVLCCVLLSSQLRNQGFREQHILYSLDTCLKIASCAILAFISLCQYQFQCRKFNIFIEFQCRCFIEVWKYVVPLF